METEATLRYIIWLTLIALGLLAACGSGTTGGAQPAPSAEATQSTPAPAPTQPPVPTAPPTQAPAPTGMVQTSTGSTDDILVTYHKSGGFAGIDETLTVHANGKLDLHSRAVGDKTAQVDPSELRELRKLLESPEFAGVQLPAPPVAPDQFVYELTVMGSAQPIVTADGAQDPPVLRQVIGELEKLRARVV
jgi:hypothetical protein